MPYPWEMKTIPLDKPSDGLIYHDELVHHDKCKEDNRCRRCERIVPPYTDYCSKSCKLGYVGLRFQDKVDQEVYLRTRISLIDY